MKRDVVLIVQARMDSTRLRGKILMPLFGKPMLQREIERLKQTRLLDRVLVATTEDTADDAVADLGHACGVGIFRGNAKDVLDRYYQAAKEAKADVIVRVTGDCPLHDPEVIDLVVEHFERQRGDYARTPMNFPEGLDTEVMSFKALEIAWQEAQLPSEREHVTPYIRNHTDRFRVDRPWKAGKIDRSHYHWSVDTEQDFKFVEAVYRHFGDEMFHVRDVLALLEKKPELLDINKGATGYEGLEKSLKEDEEFKKRHG